MPRSGEVSPKKNTNNDEATLEVLQEILSQLRILNEQMLHITDEEMENNYAD